MAHKLTDMSASNFIALLMQDCAISLKIEPSELVAGQFKEYLLETEQVVDMNSLGGFNLIKDAHFPPTPTNTKIEKKRVALQATANRKLGNVLLDKKYVLETTEKFAARVFSGRVIPNKNLFNGSKYKHNRIVNVVLSDLHIGSDLKKSKTGALDFGTLEESRRLAAVVKEIINYKPQYRKETELELLLLGDIIQGQLHDQRDGAVLAEQKCRAMHLLTQFVSQLAIYYPKIRVRCATGNHGRNTSRHRERATLDKYDSHETEIYYAVKNACSRLTNVEIFIPLTPYVSYEVFGKRILCTHGDTVLNPGNPASAINIKLLENQINKINASLSDSEEYAVAIVGHVHTASMTHLGNGTVMITNGALIPVDQFAVSIGCLESTCGQWMFESVKNYPVGDSRLIKVDAKTDKDTSLDSIIKPWSGF